MLDDLQGLVGDPIRILAFDDVEVTSVRVEIRAADNTLLEQGAATKEAEKWVYPTSLAYPKGTPITVTVTAVDRPGNKGSKMITWS